MVVGSNLCLFRVHGGVVHGRGFESLTFLGANGGVVHGRGLWPRHVRGPIQTFRARIADDICFVHEHCEISISVMQNTFNFLLYLRLRSGSFTCRSVPGNSILDIHGLQSDRPLSTLVLNLDNSAPLASRRKVANHITALELPEVNKP
jgi:hypothetical protein